MNYSFRTMASFDKDLKKLSKKYKSLKEDFKALKEELKENPLLGTDLGDGFKKIRLNITSKGQGKTGGGRVNTHEVIVNVETEDSEESQTKNILFVALYDKSEYTTVDMKIIKEVVEEYYND